MLIAAVLMNSGSSNYLQGIMLVAAYLICAIGYFVHVDVPADSE